MLESILYLGDSEKQPLVVAFGGGGNDWSRNYLKGKRDSLNKKGMEVENINGAILLLSGKNDDQWPATEMSDQIMNRLQQNNFKHYYAHIKLDDGHIAPLEHFDLVYYFLETHFKVE